MLPRSHRDTARKAFEQVTKRALPASHGALARAIEREARCYRVRIAALEHAAAAADEAGEEPDVEPVDDVDEAELREEDLEEPQAA